jgi:hypothetical protein
LGEILPITRLLSDIDLTPEQRHVIELAFNDALGKLHLVDRNDPISEMIARKVIEISSSGINDASAISETAVRARSKMKNRPPIYTTAVGFRINQSPG